MTPELLLFILSYVGLALAGLNLGWFEYQHQKKPGEGQNAQRNKLWYTVMGGTAAFVAAFVIVLYALMGLVTGSNPLQGSYTGFTGLVSYVGVTALVITIAIPLARWFMGKLPIDKYLANGLAGKPKDPTDSPTTKPLVLPPNDASAHHGSHAPQCPPAPETPEGERP